MISIDIYVMEFVSGNWLSISLALILIDGLAELTKGEGDNKVVAILKRMVTFTRRSAPKKPNG